jgi:endo-1,4-beta-xylanase
MSHKTTLILAAAVAFGGVLMSSGADGLRAAPPQKTANYNIPLWEPGKVPGALGDGPLDAPFLTVFPAPDGKRNGGAVIIAPGGSNIMLMYGAEGLDAAERYNDWGVTAFILTYRLSPRYAEELRVMEGKRAVQLVRSRAKEWGVDPNKVGYIGFSAGSNTGRSVVATAAPGNPDAPDPIDRFSSRPDYLVLVYGPGGATPGEQLKNFPPTFLVSAAGDRQPSLGNAQLFMDLTRAGAVAEIHVYQQGRHGFGSGFGSPQFGGWMTDLKSFLTLDGFLPAAK